MDDLFRRSAAPRKANPLSETDVLSRLEVLEQKESIRAVLADYCYTCDALKSASTLNDLFDEDAILLNPAGEIRGRESIVGYYREVIEDTTFSRHHIVNQVIEITAPKSAQHRAYFLAFIGRAGESKTIFGHYEDELALTGDGWKFVRKANVIDKVTILSQGWA
ncbi:nuclear transport factor 2 family protein [Gulosibacter chungangensis]|uniref:Nuclear transport factor 2 family protein n=1 Tax=Gulosibacter chungangensis TaxID=979746 RepID=A0A7J5BFV0_9MICO|nr:nuclear transport factor 2 family protein [Gulosibacter chungangensis]KAB1645104.1 nuclear transport factor 2 family protein [Gulosibacter chungangensis]